MVDATSGPLRAEGRSVRSRGELLGMIRLLRYLTAWLRHRSPRRARLAVDAQAVLDLETPPPLAFFRGDSKPYTRWWWLAGPFRREDIRYRLSWLRSNGFGGVESRGSGPPGWGAPSRGSSGSGPNGRTWSRSPGRAGPRGRPRGADLHLPRVGCRPLSRKDPLIVHPNGPKERHRRRGREM
jgi:hypothetical protein